MASELILISIAFLCALLCVVFLLKLKLLDNKETFLWQMPYNLLITLLLFCSFSLISLGYAFFTGSEVWSKNEIYSFLIIFSLSASLIANSLARRIRFAAILGEESGPKVTLPSKLKRGNTYLVKDLEKKRAFRLFSDAVALNFQGLCITRQNPVEIVKLYELSKAKLIWLTEIKNGKNLSPTDVEEISYVINNFVGHAPNSIILFDGFEYLSDYNSFNKVLHLFQVLKDSISVKKSILMIYINPQTIETQNLKLLESEFEVI